MWKKAALVVFSLLCLSPSVRAQDKSSDLQVPAEEASRKNPIATSADAIAQGKKRYEIECAACHGAEGDGKGDMVDVLKLKLRDWHDPDALKAFSDGELFYAITKGNGTMPGEGDRAQPAQIWQMVIYLRSLSKSSVPTSPPKPVAPKSQH